MNLFAHLPGLMRITLAPGSFDIGLNVACAASSGGGGSHIELCQSSLDMQFSPEPCPADFNGDGAVDFFDYLDFVDAFSMAC